MTGDAREHVSQLRQSLLRAQEQLARILSTIRGGRGPLIRGSYLEQNVRCGKATCKCARGDFHTTAVLTGTQQGIPGKTYVVRSDRERVRKLNQRYRQMRKARAALVKLNKHIIGLVDALQQALTEAYPPADRVGSDSVAKRRSGPRKENKR